MSMLTGNSITQLTETTSLLSDDLFLISEADIYTNSKRNSKKTKFNTIVDVLSANIFDRFGDMIFELSSDYSLSDHTHNDKYNCINGSITYPGWTPDQNTDISIGQIFLNGVFQTLYIPRSDANSKTFTIQKSTVEPAIGSLMFQLQGNLDSSTGWVLANGETYNINEYKYGDKLKEIYGYNTTQFKVPLINNFIKISNSKKSYPEITQQHIYTPDHSHSVNYNISGKIAITAQIICSPHAGHGSSAHNGVAPGAANTQKITSGVSYIEFEPLMTLGSGVLNEASNDQIDIYPNHYKIAVYVYIGEKI